MHYLHQTSNHSHHNKVPKPPFELIGHQTSRLHLNNQKMCQGYKQIHVLLEHMDIFLTHHQQTY